MDTDIAMGVESGLEMVLMGVTNKEQTERYLYRPTCILESGRYRYINRLLLRRVREK